MSLEGMPVRRLVGMAVNRRPVVVDGQPARLVGIPRADPGNARIEYPGGRRRTVPLASVAIPGPPDLDAETASPSWLVCGDNQLGPAQRELPGPGPQPHGGMRHD